MDFDIPTTDDIPESGKCPYCGARNWLHYYCAEDEEIGLMCGSCTIHFRDEQESQSLIGTYESVEDDSELFDSSSPEEEV